MRFDARPFWVDFIMKYWLEKVLREAEWIDLSRATGIDGPKVEQRRRYRQRSDSNLGSEQQCGWQWKRRKDSYPDHLLPF